MPGSIIFKTVIMALQLFFFVAGAPLPDEVEDGPWVNPCGGSTPVSGPSLVLPPQPIIDLVPLRLTANTAISINDELLFTIKTRIGSSLAGALESHSLTGFPETGPSFSENIKLEEMLQKDIERVSKIGVFLEQARNDTHAYTDKIHQLENKYVEMLCQMHLLMNQQGQEVTSVVSRDIMKDEYRSLTETSQIDQRNFMVIRDAQKIFVAISEGVDAFMNV